MARNHRRKDDGTENPVLVGAERGGEARVDRVDICRGVERGDDQHDEGVERDHHQLPERGGPDPDQEERDRRQGRDRAQHLDRHLGQAAEPAPPGHGQPRGDSRGDPDRAAGQRKEDRVAQVRPETVATPTLELQQRALAQEREYLGEDHLQRRQPVRTEAGGGSLPDCRRQDHAQQTPDEPGVDGRSPSGAWASETRSSLPSVIPAACAASANRKASR